MAKAGRVYRIPATREQKLTDIPESDYSQSRPRKLRNLQMSGVCCPAVAMRSVLAILVLLARAAFAQSDVGCSNMVLDQSATLADVFKAACIDERMARRSSLDLSTQITSYAVLNSPREFVIAYYVRAAGSDLLKPPLHVVRYDRRSQLWLQNDLFKSSQSGNVQVGAFQVPCLGSAMSVHRVGSFLLVGTHLSPSAQCMQVLDSELKLKDTRYGWYMSDVGGQVVYEHGMRHFSPTHPMMLSLYDPKTKNETEVYPLRPDKQREEFIDQLKHLAGFERCEGPNCSLMPEEFQSSIVEIASNESTRSFAFIAEFDPDGYVRNPQNSDLNTKVLYVCRVTADGIEQREFPAEEMKSRFGTEQVNELLVRNVLMRVFGD